MCVASARCHEIDSATCLFEHGQPSTSDPHEPNSGTGNHRADEHESLTSLSKALAAIETLASSNYGVMGVSELARTIGVPKSTAHRLLKNLEYYSLIERSGTKYLLGSRFVELGYRAKWSHYGQLREAAQPRMNALFEQTQETVNLAVLDQGEVLYLEKITGRGGTLVPSRIGARLPATCTAIGKALLAFAPQSELMDVMSAPLVRRTRRTITSRTVFINQIMRVRQERLAYETEESQDGVVCIAAPLVAESGRLFGAVSVSGPTHRFKANLAERAITLAAQRITSEVSQRLS